MYPFKSQVSEEEWMNAAQVLLPIQTGIIPADSTTHSFLKINGHLYVLDSEMLFNGGSGYVYVVKTKDSDQTFLLKIQPTVAEPNEKEILMKLQQCIETATINEKDYIVMSDYGVRLNDYLNENQLNSAQRGELAMKIIIKLEDLHAKGYSHGDIKVKNIVIDEKGNPTLIDLGKAKTDGEPTQLNKDRQSLAAIILHNLDPRPLMIKRAEGLHIRAIDTSAALQKFAIGLFSPSRKEPSSRTAMRQRQSKNELMNQHSMEIENLISGKNSIGERCRANPTCQRAGIILFVKQHIATNLAASKLDSDSKLNILKKLHRKVQNDEVILPRRKDRFFDIWVPSTPAPQSKAETLQVLSEVMQDLTFRDPDQFSFKAS